MAEFLNRERIVEEIINIIQNAKREVVMVVPYIKISPNIWNELIKAEKNGIEILLIYRESCMNDSERKKLYSLSNLTIINHPNVHAKCYLNEKSMIICSMNLYEYSEKNNREMGILIDNDDENEDFFSDYSAYEDCINEIRQIKNASRLEKQSDVVKEKGFNFKILQQKEEILKNYIEKINKIFIHKDFKVLSDGYGEPKISCFPYYENITAILDPCYTEDIQEINVNIHRIELKFHHSQSITRNLHKQFWRTFPEKKFEEYNIYWNHYKRKLTIYPNRKQYPQWNKIEFEPTVKKFRQGLDVMIDYIREVEKNI